MTRRRAIRAVDDVWLKMDQPDNAMVVEGLMLVAEPVDVERLRSLVVERVLDTYPVFSQRPVARSWPSSAQQWEDDGSFDVRRHVIETTLPAPGDDLALQDYVAHLLSRAIDRSHPLWEVHLIQGYGDGCAIYSRLHHALADGMALTRVILALTDTEAMPSQVEAAPRTVPRAGLVGTALGLARGATTLPVLAIAAPAVLSRLVLARRPTGPLSVSPHHEKRAVWAEPVPVATLSAIGHLTGTTVTDVAMAALAGAVRAWLEQRGADCTHDVPTMVPVDLRRPGEPLPRELGNQFALVLLDLPVSVPTAQGRLIATHDRMSAIKGSSQAQLTYLMLQVMGRTIPPARRILTDFFAAKAVGVTTSVRGPSQPLWLAGGRVERILGWAPLSGAQTISTCLVSHDGQLQVGLKVDTTAVPDPESITRAFGEEVTALAVSLAQSPAP